MRCFCKRVAAVLAILLLTLCFRCVGEETAYEGPSLFTAKAEAAFWDGWFEETPAELSFDDMYAGSSSLGLELSDRLQGLAGKRVHMTGFMAPLMLEQFPALAARHVSRWLGGKAEYLKA